MNINNVCVCFLIISSLINFWLIDQFQSIIRKKKVYMINHLFLYPAWSIDYSHKLQNKYSSSYNKKIQSNTFPKLLMYCLSNSRVTKMLYKILNCIIISKLVFMIIRTAKYALRHGRFQ